MQRRQGSSSLPLLVLTLLLLAGLGLWWLLASENVDPESRTPVAASESIDSEKLRSATGEGRDGSVRAASNEERRHELSQVFRVLDADTGEGIVGARVALFDSDEEEIGSITTEKGGRADLPGDPRVVGLAVSAKGYEIGGVGVGVWTVRLRPCPTVKVRVAGASEALLRDYELLASLHYKGLSEPWEWARQVHESQESEPTPLVEAECAVLRPIEKPCRVVLHGRHRAAGILSKFATEWLGSADDSVVFRAESYAAPTGNWAHIKVILPDPAERRVSQVVFEYRNQSGNWEWWGRQQGFGIRQSPTEVEHTFVELWPVHYRIKIRFASEEGGAFESDPFLAKGGVRRTIRIRGDGEQSITFRFLGEDRHLFDPENENTVLRRGSLPAGGLRERLRSGVVRFTHLRPGSYELRCVGRTLPRTFSPRRVTLGKGQRLQVDIDTEIAVALKIQLPAKHTPFSVTRSGESRLVPREVPRAKFVYFSRQNQWVARLPLGAYTVRVGEDERGIDLGTHGATMTFVRD